MLKILGLVATIALADSLNPSTVGPALYIASGDRARRAVLEFTLAVFVVHFAGGAFLVLGPGHLLLSLVDKLARTTREALELAAGVALLCAGMLMWGQRRRLARKDPPTPTPKRKSSLLLGATIAAVELPTAFPYLAAITAILASRAGTPGQIALLGVYNLGFTLPLFAVLLILLLGGRHAEERLAHVRVATEGRWPHVFAMLLLLLGLAVTGLAGAALIGA